jgi:colanic acid/amylovoran biosynthesis glycosyltransferase
MDRTDNRLTILQGKFAAYLSWSQPFIHQLVRALGEQVRNVVVCNRTENLDRFPTENVVRFKTRYLVTPTFALLASSHLQRAWKPQVMHAHFGWSGIRMLLLKQFLRIPLVVSFGGRDVGVQMHMPYFDQLYRVLLDVTDQIICVSEDLKRQLVEHGVAAERIRVIRRGVDLRRFDFVDRANREAGAPVKLLMVGRCVEKKGHRYVFDALAQLVREGADVRLTIVGEGEEYHRLRKLRNALGLRHIVDFAGVTNHEGVRQQMTEADIFLQCSVTGADGDCEGIPNVVVEAAATGLPVLGTRHGGIVEPVQHERNGLLVGERDVPAMVQALRRLVKRREERLSFGTAGATLMHAQWDLNRQVEQHLEIYERLAAEWRPKSPQASRVFIPPDFSEIAGRAIQARGNAKEFSLAELAELLVMAERLRVQVSQPEPGLFERLYDLKRFVPQPVKFPMKLALGRLLNAAIELRYRGLRLKWAEHQRELDGRVLRYFQDGGDLSTVETDWSLAEIERLASEKPRTRRDASRPSPAAEPLKTGRTP